MGSAFSNQKTAVSTDPQHNRRPRLHRVLIAPLPLRYTGAGAVMYGVV